MAENMQLQNSPQMLLPRDMSPTDQKPMWPWKRWFNKEDDTTQVPNPQESAERPSVPRRLSRKAIPGLPRPGTFKRQQSELRDKLEPIKPIQERRAISVDRRPKGQTREHSNSAVAAFPRVSAPALGRSESSQPEYESKGFGGQPQIEELDQSEEVQKGHDPAPTSVNDEPSESGVDFDDELLEELEKRWILNLSMHFRDRSNREKFFVTFAESPSCWRRVTISLDYRHAPAGSLEEELQRIQFQRDKSARIYESIRESLPDIQFYETVTNLKLQTENERLHVHVTEDIHEVIRYPQVSAINHLDCPRIREDELSFDSHLSGFVYKVKLHGEVLIKKEIPGPDTVEEFLYEINALHRLRGSKSVIQFGGVVTDVEGKILKGLLISYAEKGALIDVIFDGKGELPWFRRARWAKQIVQGLSEIHEAGFVQGDFTLSNIVIDGDDEAKIIDINRRGCPVGWEPPEVAALIDSKQRISMYIGVKSDIFQLGMVLWAIAMEQDEPEIQPKPLTLADGPEEIPDYYRELVGICLSDDPRDRSHTSSLLTLFPDSLDMIRDPRNSARENLDHGSLEEREADPLSMGRRDEFGHDHFEGTRSPVALGSTIPLGAHPDSQEPRDEMDDSDFSPERGRSPPASDPETTEQPLESNHKYILDEILKQDKPYESNFTEPDVVAASAPTPGHEYMNKEVEEEPEQDRHPRTTAAAPESIPGDLIGVGQHSTLEHSHFPAGIEDDDLTI